MAEKTEIDIFVMMDADGDYAVGVSEDEVRTLYEENIASVPIFPVRIVKLTGRMTVPAVEEASIDIPDTDGTTEQVEVEAA